MPLIPVTPDDWMDDREALEDMAMRVELWEQRLGDEPERTPGRVRKAGEEAALPKEPSE
jgi:hypothetical protein